MNIEDMIKNAMANRKSQAASIRSAEEARRAEVINERQAEMARRQARNQMLVPFMEKAGEVVAQLEQNEDFHAVFGQGHSPVFEEHTMSDEEEHDEDEAQNGIHLSSSRWRTGRPFAWIISIQTVQNEVRVDPEEGDRGPAQYTQRQATAMTICFFEREAGISFDTMKQVEDSTISVVVTRPEDVTQPLVKAMADFVVDHTADASPRGPRR